MAVVFKRNNGILTQHTNNLQRIYCCVPVSTIVKSINPAIIINRQNHPPTTKFIMFK